MRRRHPGAWGLVRCRLPGEPHLEDGAPPVPAPACLPEAHGRRGQDGASGEGCRAGLSCRKNKAW